MNFIKQFPLFVTDYLPHVDGLRAVAVLSVILFHMDIDQFSGGYVGVDIFFVISGYLITSHVISSLTIKKFSFSTFYNRRIRRLFPSLLTTIFATFVSGVLILPAPNLERLGSSSIFSIFSMSNFFFWFESGYFDADASLKPLLHLWSLAVEEQFYLVWPAILMGVWKISNETSRDKRFRFVFLFVLAYGSFALCELMIYQSASSAFFLTPFRIPEFAVGALLLSIHLSPHDDTFLMEVLSLAGFIAIGLAVFGFSETTRFPGLTALLPCTGTAFLIYAGKTSVSGSFLRNPTMVNIGKMSYSLYLVHWPIIVYYKYNKLSELNKWDRVFIVMITFGLGFAWYRYIEKPFRAHIDQRYKISSKQFYRIIGGCTSIVLLFAVSAHYNHGWGWRFDRFQFTAESIQNGMNKRTTLYNRLCEERGWENCTQPSQDKSKNILVIGDSHALDGFNIFYQAFPDFHYTMLDLGGCPPLIEKDTALLSPDHPDRKKCIDLNIERFNTMAKNNYVAIIISVLFDWYDVTHLMHSIKKIKQNSDAIIIVLGNYIQLKTDFVDLANRSIPIDQYNQHIYSFALYEEKLRKLAPNNFIFISKKDILCSDDQINNCKFWFEEIPFSYDRHHLSFEASTYLANHIQKQLK